MRIDILYSRQKDDLTLSCLRRVAFRPRSPSVSWQVPLVWLKLVAGARNSYCSHGLGCGFEHETGHLPAKFQDSMQMPNGLINSWRRQPTQYSRFQTPCAWVNNGGLSQKPPSDLSRMPHDIARHRTELGRENKAVESIPSALPEIAGSGHSRTRTDDSNLDRPRRRILVLPYS